MQNKFPKTYRYYAFNRRFLSAYSMRKNWSASYIKMMDCIYRSRSDAYNKDTVRPDVKLLKYLAKIIPFLYVWTAIKDAALRTVTPGRVWRERCKTKEVYPYESLSWFIYNSKSLDEVTATDQMKCRTRNDEKCRFKLNE